jgi:hypothetical protein
MQAYQALDEQNYKRAKRYSDKLLLVNTKVRPECCKLSEIRLILNGCDCKNSCALALSFNFAMNSDFESELAGVLSHEISHVTQNHLVRFSKKSGRKIFIIAPTLIQK